MRASREIEAGGSRSRDSRQAELVPENASALVALRLTPEEKEEALQRARLKRDALDEQLSSMSIELTDTDRLYAGRKCPLQLELEAVRAKREELLLELETRQHHVPEMPDPPGPKSLAWVDGSCFGALSNLAVVANLSCMALAPMYPQWRARFQLADHAFLAWYCFELSVKFIYHRRNLFFGKISVVWWNWFDLGIVLSGVLDQWLVPLVLGAVTGSSGGLPISANALRTLRLLRLFRILRFLKLARAFLQGDASWLQSPAFEVFMSVVIALNAVVMSLELDYEWPNWVYVENTFLTLYVLELAIKMKVGGCAFWTDHDNMMWNYLDFIIVSAGVLDLWLMPAAQLFEREVLNMGDDAGAMPGGVDLSAFPKLMRIFRIFRILRLVRLVKVIKPLYRLLLCVMEAMQAMQWVLVLTFIMLYGGAIFWTTLVGRGLIYENSEVPEEVQVNFGHVSTSLFSLFRLMNGDTDEVHQLFSSEVGKLLFVGFMVLSNWAILAILTSVVSDNMISTSRMVSEEEARKNRAEEYEKRVDRLQALFREIDSDGSGAISHSEWRGLF
mmetsp:Transcript_70238/g.196892  ORF Transcript_70238/g.196892 Transcript_70238/m.196892 type:complete len:558 (-) Transcript_70238:26-1699(-)